MEEDSRPGHARPDGLLTSLNAANFRVCEVSKLVQRIRSLQDTIVLRAKFQRLASKALLNYNIDTIRKFRKLSRGFDLISDFRIRRGFKRWKLRKQWASLGYRALHENVKQQIAGLEDDAVAHQHKKRQKKWVKLCRGVILEEKRSTLREVYNDHEMWMKQLYFFNLWKFRLNRKHDIRRARANRWHKLVDKLAGLNLRKNLRKELTGIDQQRKWQSMVFENLHRETMRNIRVTCNRAKQQWTWYDIVDGYMLMNFRKRLEVDANHLRQQRNWCAFSKHVLHQDCVAKLETSQLMCLACAKVRAAVAAFMSNHVREQLVFERARRTEKVERRKRLEALANVMSVWHVKAETKRKQGKFVKGMFKDATNQYMLGVANAAAVKIQNAFLRMRHKQLVKRRLVQRCFMGWRKLPTRVTFNCVEFPEIAVACELRFDFQVSKFVTLRQFPIDDLAPLKPCYDMKEKEREIMIDQVTARKVSGFRVEIVPYPKVSARSLYTCLSRQKAIDAMEEARGAIVEEEPIPFQLDLSKPIYMVTEAIEEGSCFLKEQIPFSEPELDSEFMKAMSDRVTKRALNKLFIPPFEESIEVSSLRQPESTPSLLVQYDEVAFFDEMLAPDFSLLVNLDASIEPVDHIRPCKTPMNLGVVPSAMRKLDVSGVYSIGNDFVKVKPIAEYTPINEPVFEIDDYFLREATSGFGLNKTRQPVLDLYTEEFEYMKRMEHHKLLIYDHDIHSEAVTAAIGLDEVFTMATSHISIDGIPHYREIESGMEKRLVIDEKRVEEPLEEVFREITLNINGLDTYEKSGYVEETPEEGLTIQWPLEDFNIALSKEPIESCTSSKIVNDDEEFVIGEIRSSMKLAVVPTPEFDEVMRSENYAPAEIEEVLLQDADSENIGDCAKEVIPDDHVHLDENLVENIVMKVHVAKKDIPEGEKLDLNSVCDLDVQTIDAPNSWVDPLLHTSVIEEPDMEEEYDTRVLVNADAIIKSLCDLDKEALCEFQPIQVPDVESLPDELENALAFDAEFVNMSAMAAMSHVSAGGLPDVTGENSFEAQADEVAAEVMEVRRDDVSIQEDCTVDKAHLLLANWEPSGYDEDAAGL